MIRATPLCRRLDHGGAKDSAHARYVIRATA